MRMLPKKKKKPYKNPKYKVAENNFQSQQAEIQPLSEWGTWMGTSSKKP